MSGAPIAGVACIGDRWLANEGIRMSGAPIAGVGFVFLADELTGLLWRSTSLVPGLQQ